MKIHEYQAKELFTRSGIPIPRGRVASRPAKPGRFAGERAVTPLVVEAQTHAGGRGKADGVNLAHFVEEEARLAGEILGMTLMTHQTNPHGRVVSKVLVEADLEIEKELYLGIVPDRTSATPVFMARETAEMDIEEVIVKR